MQNERSHNYFVFTTRVRSGKESLGSATVLEDLNK